MFFLVGSLFEIGSNVLSIETTYPTLGDDDRVIVDDAGIEAIYPTLDDDDRDIVADTW